MWEQREHWLRNLAYTTEVWAQQHLQDPRVAVLARASRWAGKQLPNQTPEMDLSQLSRADYTVGVWLLEVYRI